jgi:hypothetical protein
VQGRPPRDLSSGRSWHTRTTPAFLRAKVLLRARSAVAMRRKARFRSRQGGPAPRSGRAFRTWARFKANFDRNHADLDETRPEGRVEVVRGRTRAILRTQSRTRAEREPNESRPGRRRGGANGALRPFQERATGRPNTPAQRPRLLGSPGQPVPTASGPMCLALVDRAGLDRCNTGPTEHFGAKAQPGRLSVGAYVAGRRWPTGDRTK